MTARLLIMERSEDVSGVSGTGVIGEAVEFSDGTTVVRWLTKYRSTVVYGSLKEAIAIHGHDGRTQFVERSDVPQWCSLATHGPFCDPTKLHEGQPVKQTDQQGGKK